MNLSQCRLCPRECGIDRLNDKTGFCGAGKDAVIGLYSLHKWEEPCISGSRGSGTIFFSNCTLKCVYCQNYLISRESVGRKVSASELCEIYLKLQEKGAHNINLVTPTHYALQIKESLILAKEKGLKIPVVYNTSGYERPEILSEFEGLIDVYMPDFKYWRSAYSEKYSMAPDYPERVKAAIKEMARQVLPAKFEDGIMTKGLLVRHLLLPGLLYDAKKIIDYLYKNYGNSIWISIMSQYTPLNIAEKYPELMKSVGRREYNALCEYAARLGVENAFIQEEGAVGESFIPEFFKD